MLILSKKISLILFVSILLICLSYLYIDRSFAFWSHDQNFARYSILNGFTYVVEYVEGVIVLLYGYLIFQFLYKKRINLFDQKLLVIVYSLALAFFINKQIKFIFGRYWPQTWKGNQSLIEHNAYGFDFFHEGGSFPSGHATCTFAIATAIWIVFPRFRLLAVSLAFFTIIGQLGMNYHFVSDILAGGLLGSLIAYCIAETIKTLGHADLGQVHSKNLI